MALKLIYARSRNGVIGRDNRLPWHLPEDLAHFKRSTMGCAVLMGRKTWDSIPSKFRPLPGRRNLVLTRQGGWRADGAEVVHSLAAALDAAGRDATLWVIGGAELYAHSAQLADEAVVTEIDADFDGDAFAPVLGPDWLETRREAHVSAQGLAYAFVHFRHRTGGH